MEYVINVLFKWTVYHISVFSLKQMFNIRDVYTFHFALIRLQRLIKALY